MTELDILNVDDIDLEDLGEDLEDDVETVEQLQYELRVMGREILVLAQKVEDRDKRDVALGRAITSWINDHTDETPARPVVDALIGILLETEGPPW